MGVPSAASVLEVTTNTAAGPRSFRDLATAPDASAASKVCLARTGLATPAALYRSNDVNGFR